MNASSITGRVFAACTSETSTAAFGLSITSHWAPTVCIQVPIALTRTPSHSHRNARRRSGAHADDDAADAAAEAPAPGTSLRSAETPRPVLGVFMSTRSGG